MRTEVLRQIINDIREDVRIVEDAMDRGEYTFAAGWALGALKVAMHRLEIVVREPEGETEGLCKAIFGFDIKPEELGVTMPDGGGIPGRCRYAWADCPNYYEGRCIPRTDQPQCGVWADEREEELEELEDELIGLKAKVMVAVEELRRVIKKAIEDEMEAERLIEEGEYAKAAGYASSSLRVIRWGLEIIARGLEEVEE